jgi:subtilisin-like proprotein convertase family protein/PKD repeat protein
MKRLLLITAMLLGLFATNTASAQYCTPSSGWWCSDDIFEYINRFEVSNLNYTSPCASTGYSDYSGTQSATVIAGNSYTWTMDIIYPFSSDVADVWVDFNNDGDFADAGELVSTDIAAASGTATASFTVPAVAPGNYRMRIDVRDNTVDDPADPCAALQYGEMEDYTLTVAQTSFQTACNVGIAITDNTCNAIATVPVSGIGVLNSGFALESVEVNITHTWDSDVDMSLVSPNGTIINLSDDNGGSGDNYGDVASSCTINTRFIMSAATAVTAGTAPFLGDYIPEGNLDLVNTNAENADGNWQLVVCDDLGGDVGTINFFKLNFVSSVVVPPAPAIVDSFLTVCGVGTSIPDATCPNNTLTPIVVSGISNTLSSTPTPGTHTFQSAEIIIDHTWDSDLDVYLQSPSGTIVELTTDNGGSGDDYGNPNNCTLTTRFIMSATNLVTAGVAPMIGDYLPEGNLGDFNNGQDPNGTWNLLVCDDLGGDLGTVYFVQLNFVENPLPPLVYCTPSATNNCGSNWEYISNFALNTINNPSACDGSTYTDYSATISTQLQQGLPYTATTTIGIPWTTDVTDIWIDLNNDGDFDDAGELVSTGNPQTGGISTGTVVVPLGTSLGDHRLRLGMRDAQADLVADPCAILAFGEFEDYNIEVLAAPACLPPTTLSASNIGTDQAQLNWNLVAGALSYDVQYRAVGDPNWIFVGNFLDPTSSTIINGLNAQTAYEFQVQSRCSGSDTSGYPITEQFSTACFDCPIGGVAEAENCGDDNNGGCNMVTPTYEPITAGVPVCGTGWADGSRDTDWYEFTIAQTSTVTLTVNSDFPGAAAILDASQGCGLLAIVDFQTTDVTCATTVSTATLCAGTYIAFVAPSVFSGFPCGSGNNYNAVLDVVPVTVTGNISACSAIEIPVGQSCTPQTFDNLSSIYCGGSGGTNPGCANYAGGDVWFYLIVPPSGDVTLAGGAGTITDGGMAAYVGSDCNNLAQVGCDDDSGPGFLPTLNLQGLNPGDTLWIQYWQYGGGTGTFDLCAFDCNFVPGVGTLENEPCFTDVNGGCNSFPPIYQTLSCNETIIGTSYFDGFTRDTDWFEYTITSTTSVSWTVQADFAPVIFILNDDCNNIQLIAQGTGNACDVVTATAVLGPGVYHFFVAPDFSSTFDCTGDDGDYQATLNVSVPDASIGGPTNACLSDLPFSIIAANPGGTYSSNGAGITDPLNGVFDPAAAGVGTWDIYYSIVSNGCTNGDTMQITVQDIPAAAITPSGADSLCYNPADQTYCITGIAGADTYNWILTPSTAGTVTGTDTCVVVNFDDTFSGTASLVVAGVNECGTGAFSTSFDIVVTPLPGQAGTPAGPNSLCQGAVPTDYTSAGDPASTTYAWSIVTTPANGATIAGTGSTATVTWDPNFVGTADITVTGSNSCGTGTVSSTYTVTINATTPSVIDPIQGSVCASGSYQLTATPAGGTFSGDDVDASGLFTPASGAGTYVILYTPAGGCSSPSTLTVDVSDIPATPATPLGISSQCQDGPNTTVFVIPVNGATSYTWSVTPSGAFDNVTDNGNGSVTVDWASNFFGQAEFIVSATNGCGTSLFSGMHIITINPNPVAQITPSGPYCVTDQCFQLSADMTGFWSSNCASSLTSDGLFCPSVAGTCDVSITVVANGCQGTATSQVNVQPAVVATITVPATICEDDAPVNLVGSPANGDWTGDVDANGVFTPTAPGSYSATYSVDNGGGCAATVTENFDVNGLPVASFSYSAQCQALTFFNESAYSDGASFFWEFGDGIESSAENTSHVYNLDGSVQVTLTVTNDCGTSDTTVNVVVIKCVGIDETVVDQLSLYPNPTNGLVNVFFNSGKAQNYMLNVVDVTGKVLYTENLNNFVGQYNNPIDFSRFAAGMYIFRVVAEDGRATNVKVVRD